MQSKELYIIMFIVYTSVCVILYTCSMDNSNIMEADFNCQHGPKNSKPANLEACTLIDIASQMCTCVYNLRHLIHFYADTAVISNHGNYL